MSDNTPTTSQNNTNPTKRFRQDGSPSSEPELISPAILQAFQAMLDSSLDKCMTQISTKLDAQASQIAVLQSTTETNTRVMNNMRAELDLLRNDHHGRLERLDSNVTSQTTELCNLKSQLEGLRGDIKSMQSEKEKLNSRLIDQEARGRRDNLLFHGIPEQKEENVCETISTFLKDKLQITDGSTIIDRAHRLGKPKSGTHLGHKADKPRPIIVKFYRFKERERVREKRFDLSPPFSMSEDLPMEIREARKSLSPQFQELKNKGKKPYIVYPAVLMCNHEVMAKADPCNFSSSRNTSNQHK